MATTESRTGFRLPWSSEERSDKAPVGRTAEATTTDEATGALSEATSAPEAVEEATPVGVEATAADSATEGTPEMTSSVEPAETTEFSQTDQPTASEPSPKETSVESTATAAPAPSRTTSEASVAKKPTKFVLDLTKAMQSAAEESRAQTLGQFQADAKAYIENIHSRSAGEATDLRKRSDEDIAGIQEWSKAEIARIREETQGKISERKLGLERELEEHAGQIEYEIDRVQSRVAGFELEMERFFELLVAEEDPTQIAVMAQSLPEPPSFDASIPWQPSAAVAELIGDTPVNATSSPAEIETDEVTEQPTAADETTDGEAAMAAIEAAHQAAESSDADASSAEAEAGTEAESDFQASPTDANDPRLAALGLSPSFDAAEAEAAAEATQSSDDEIPTMGDDALAARLAGLVPPEGEGDARPARAASDATSRVVVSGLVSVASIASFKRHLGRVTGVQSVGVSSGPDGEFVFTVHHDNAVNLREVVPSLPGFRARVTNAADGVVTVVAHDPESGN